MKDISEYTTEELAEIGRNTVISRQKRYAQQAEDAKLARKLVKAVKEGKMKVPDNI